MPIALRGTPQSAASGTGGQTGAVSVPTGIVNGDFMLARVAGWGDGTTGPSAPVNPSGWTLIGNAVSGAGGTDVNFSWYYRVAASEPASYTFSVGATGSKNYDFEIVAFSGVDTSNPFNLTSLSAHGTSATATSADLGSTSKDGCWHVLAFESFSTSTGTISGYTEDDSFDLAAATSWHKQISPPGATGAQNMALSSSSGWVAWAAALQPGLTSVPVPLPSPIQQFPAFGTEALYRRFDPPVLPMAYYCYPADSVGPAADSVPVRFWAGLGTRPGTDTTGPASDTLAAAQALTRAFTESVGAASDTLVRLFVGLRAPSETFGPATDSAPVRAFIGTRAETEIIGPSADSLVRNAAPMVATETVGPAADAAPVRAFAGFGIRPTTDAVGPASDVASPRTSLSRSVSDSLSAAADALVRFWAGTGVRPGTDAVGPAGDVPARTWVGARSDADSVGPASDVLVASQALVRAVADTLSAASDAATRVINFLRRPTDIVGPPTDAPARQGVFSRASGTETIGPAADTAPARAGSYGRTGVDTVGPASDTVSRPLVLLRVVADALTGAADGVARLLAGSRAPAETLTTSDTASRQDQAARRPAETVGPASDVPVAAQALLRSATEALSAAVDGVSRLLRGSRSSTDAVGPASDSPARLYGPLRALAEALTTIDSTVRAWVGARGPADAPGPASDSLVRNAGRTVTEVVGPATDAMTRVARMLRSLADVVGAARDSVLGKGKGQGIVGAHDWAARTTGAHDVAAATTGAHDQLAPSVGAHDWEA